MLLRDGVTHHPKVLAAGPEAAWLWVAAIDYSRQHLTDGHLAAAVLPTLGVFRTPMKRLVDRLVEVRLFVPEGDGYTVKDFLEHNDSRQTVEGKRRAAAERTAAWRARHAGGDAPVTASQAHTYPSPPHLSRTRAPAFGVGVGTVTGSESLRDGEPERKGVLAADVYECWREVAAAHGTDLRLGASPTDTRHCMALADAYALEELRPAMGAWWASPHTGGRNLGLFVAQLPEVLGHLAAGGGVFRAPLKPRPVEDTEWVPPEVRDRQAVRA